MAILSVRRSHDSRGSPSYDYTCSYKCTRVSCNFLQFQRQWLLMFKSAFVAYGWIQLGTRRFRYTRLQRVVFRKTSTSVAYNCGIYSPSQSHARVLYIEQILAERALQIPGKVGWLRSTVVEHRYFAGELSLFCARPAADRWTLMWVHRPLQVNQLGQLSLSSFRGQ